MSALLEEGEEQVSCFVIGIAVKDLIELLTRGVDLANRNEVENIGQVLSFFETLGVFHCMELQCDEVHGLGDGQARRTEIEFFFFGVKFCECLGGDEHDIDRKGGWIVRWRIQSGEVFGLPCPDITQGFKRRSPLGETLNRDQNIHIKCGARITIGIHRMPADDKEREIESPGQLGDTLKEVHGCLDPQRAGACEDSVRSFDVLVTLGVDDGIQHGMHTTRFAFRTAIH